MNKYVSYILIKFKNVLNNVLNNETIVNLNNQTILRGGSLNFFMVTISDL